MLKHEGHQQLMLQKHTRMSWLRDQGTHLCTGGQHLLAGYLDSVPWVLLTHQQRVSGWVQATRNIRTCCPNTIQYTAGKHDNINSFTDMT